MRYFTIFFFLLISLSLSAQHDHPHHHRVKVLLEGRNIQELAALGLEVDHGHYAPFKHLINDFSDSELRLLSEAGFNYEVMIADVAKYYADPTRALNNGTSRGGDPCEEGGVTTSEYPYSTPSHFRLGSMGGFFTYEEALLHLDSMRILYPDLISSRQAIGNISTHEGRPIFWLRLSDNPDTDEAHEDEILYTSIHHAREPNSLSQTIFYMWYLLENYETDPEIQYLVNNTALYFIPCINPDGYVFNQQTNPDGGGMWRKNRRDNGNGTIGVDLNRNYGYNWGFDNEGSSPNSGSDVYRGTSGFSEPETQAVKLLCDEHEFLVTLNYHTHGNLLIYPWGYSDQPTTDHDYFSTFSKVMTLQNNYLAGTGTETVGYTVNGDSDDWMYGETESKPSIFSMTPEVGSEGFWPAPNEIIPNCKATVWMNMMAANIPHNSALVLDDINQHEIDADDPFFNFEVQRFGLTDGDVTVSIVPLQPSLISVAEAAKTYQLGDNELKADSFALSVLSTIDAGTELGFVAELDNGHFVRKDTFYRAFGGFINTAVFSDNGNNTNNWTSDSWGATTESFVSAPSSLTDSPNAPYENNTTNELLLQEPITVGDALQYKLRFWAKWNIEADYDYNQLFFRVNGGNWIAACGRYTVAGAPMQDQDQPLWEGQQLEWVEEEIDLTGHVSEGDQIELRFQLTADGWVNPDGFYIDDLELVEQNMGVVNTTHSLNTNDFKLQIAPNPTHTQAHLKFRLSNEYQGKGQWQLFKSDGSVVKTGELFLRDGFDQINVDLHELPSGIYWVNASGDQWQIAAQKLIVIK